jgi:hypothetical protein
VNKTHTTPLNPQSDGMVERYINTLEEHLRKVVASHQGDSVARLPIFFHAYRAPTHNTTGLTPTNLVFGRELRLPIELLFGAPLVKEQPTIDHADDLVDRLHIIHNYARQHLKLASDRMKTRYKRAAYCSGYHEGDNMWLYRPTHTKGKSPKLQSPWEGPYTIVARINDVV